MPLVKTVFNRRIVRTQRIGKAIRILLERRDVREPRQWITISADEYSSTVDCRFVPREGTSRDDAE